MVVLARTDKAIVTEGLSVRFLFQTVDRACNSGRVAVQTTGGHCVSRTKTNIPEQTIGKPSFCSRVCSETGKPGIALLYERVTKCSQLIHTAPNRLIKIMI